jgi:D-aminoacyl-tRNA deacylase
VFIEIGSTPEEWRDPKAREAMALAVIDVIRMESLPSCKPVAGFGGSHYPIKFTKLHLDSEFCFGHIIPKYAFNIGVTESVIKQAIIKSYPKEAEIGVIEKKSLKSKDRKLVQEVLESMGKEHVFV